MPTISMFYGILVLISFHDDKKQSFAALLAMAADEAKPAYTLSPQLVVRRSYAQQGIDRCHSNRRAAFSA